MIEILLILTGSSALMALIHLIFIINKVQVKENLNFLLMSLSCIGYVSCDIFMYKSITVEELLWFNSIKMFFLSGFLVGFLLFTKDFLKREITLFLKLYIVVLILLPIARLFSPGLGIYENIKGLHTFSIFGDTLHRIDADSTTLSLLIFGIIIGVFVYTSFLVFFVEKKHRVLYAITTILFLGFGLSDILNDTFSLGIVDISEFGFLSIQLIFTIKIATSSLIFKGLESRLELKDEYIKLSELAMNGGIWEYHVKEKKFIISDYIFEKITNNKPDGNLSYKEFKSRYTSDEFIEKSINLFEQCIANEIDVYSIDIYYKENDLWIMEYGSIAEYDSTGKPSIITGTMIDITHRKKIEEQNRKSEERFKELAKLLPEPIFETDIHGKLTFLNDVGMEKFNFTQEDFIAGISIEDLVVESDREKIVNNMVLRLDGTLENYTEYSMQSQSGELFPTKLQSRPIISNNRAIGVRTVIHDISDQVEYQRKIKESFNMLELVMNNIPQFVFWKNLDLEYIGCNDNFAKAAGLQQASDIVGKTDFDLPWKPEEAEAFRTDDMEVITNDKPKYHIIEKQMQDDGKEAWLDTNKVSLKNSKGDTIGILGTFEDITARIELESRLQQAQKMDAIGQLSGGIAHDFNNMLSGIISSVDLIEMCDGDFDRVKNYSGIIKSAAFQASDLTTKLLSFARKSESIKPVNVNIHEIIENSMKLLERSIDKRITLKSELQSNVDLVLAEQSQIQNIFINLGINASQAMNDTEGEIFFKTSRVTLTAKDCENFIQKVEPGQFIHIQVKDSGSGIPTKNLTKIFEPFFTTKKEKGTGLGLASVYTIISQHQGSITVYSEPDNGTVFHIYLPLCLENNDRTLETHTEEILYGKGTILVVDDEDIVRDTARSILEELGYEVIVANNGEEGVEKFKENLKSIDIVILDMIMPKMNGSSCFIELKKLDKKVKVILASGFSKEEDLKIVKENGVLDFMQKPYDLLTLSHKVFNAMQL